MSSAAARAHGSSIELDRVTKHYGTVRAVEDFTLGVPASSFVTLLGPSGSGKTTVLHLIAGFLDPTSGAIRIDGKPATSLPPERRNVGIVFQNYALFPHLSVAQNLAFPLQMRRVGAAEIARRVAEALDLVGLAGLDGRRPKELSGGQQQRVALARALIYRPAVLLMDEPLGALDKNLRLQMQTEIRRIQKDLGLTVLYVTHDQTEALALSDELCVVAAGRVVQSGPPRELYDRPGSEFVATFLGEANLLRGEVTEIDAGRALARARSQSGLAAVAGASSAGSVGAQVTIVVRPEDISLAPADAGAVGVVAVVRSTAFVGDAFRVQLVAADGTNLVALVPKTERPPELGSKVSASWREDQATFVMAESERSNGRES